MSEVAQQLGVFHDPFSRATKQPKIPDGKVTESLGFSVQSVTEATIRSGSNVMHMMLFPGQNCGIIYDPENSADLGTRTYYVPEYGNAGGPDWSDLLGVAPVSGDVTLRDNYALWRIVSQGLQLKLLNPAEQDDGWWEAVRVTEPITTTDYFLTTTDDSSNVASNGALTPDITRYGATSISGGTLRDRNLVNEPSYSTGLLRDLHKVQFNLHGKLDHHDFSEQKLEIDSGSISDYVPAILQAQFDQGIDNQYDLIKNYIDSGYDMIYLRIHGRPSGTTPTRLHVNVVSNQEVSFGTIQRESRYQTKSENLGSAAEKHASVRNMQNSAAHIVA